MKSIPGPPPVEVWEWARISESRRAVLIRMFMPLSSSEARTVARPDIPSVVVASPGSLDNGCQSAYTWPTSWA